MNYEIDKELDEEMDIGLGIVGLIILIHFIGLLVLWVVALSTDVTVAQAAGMTGYWVLNSAFALFSGIWVGAIFSVKRLWAKILLYPIAVVLLLLVLCGLAFPAAIISVVIGTCCGGA